MIRGSDCCAGEFFTDFGGNLLSSSLRMLINYQAFRPFNLLTHSVEGERKKS